jgi:hypothetical protein
MTSRASPVAVGATTPPNPAARRAAGIVAALVFAAAAVLRGLDSVPAWLRGEPRGVRAFDSIEALERDVRTQLLLPFYFPETMVWPPQAVYRARGDGRPTSLVFTDRTTGTPRLVIAQCLDGACTIPARLLLPGIELQRTAVEVAGAQALLIRQELPGRGTWTDLTWDQHGRRIRLRMYGDDADLLRIARSMRRGHP